MQKRMITIYRDGKNHGPFSIDEIALMIRNGKFCANDLGWEPGLSEWKKLGDFSEVWGNGGRTSSAEALNGQNPKNRSRLAMVFKIIGATVFVFFAVCIIAALVLPIMVRKLAGSSSTVTSGTATTEQPQRVSKEVEEARSLLRTRTDVQRGVSLLQAAASTGDVDALVTLGGMYSFGVDLPTNLAKGEQLLLEAASKGSNRAHYILGQAYSKGTFRGQSENEKAIQHFRISAENGNQDAKVNVAVLLLDNPSSSKNDQLEALSILESVAQKNDPTSLRYLGYTHLSGLVGPANYSQAALYYRKAAELGDLESMHDLFQMAANWPDIVAIEEGAFWLNKAADQNFIPAINIRNQLTERSRQENINKIYADAQRETAATNPFYAAGKNLHDKIQSGSASGTDFAKAAAIFGLGLLIEDAKLKQEDAKWKPGTERSFYYDQSSGSLIYSDRQVQVRDDSPVIFVRDPR